MIAAAMDPAHEHDIRALVGCAENATTVGAAQFAQKIQCNGGFHKILQFRAAASFAAISSLVRLCCSPVDMSLKA
jgi:hypothetical protein